MHHKGEWSGGVGDIPRETKGGQEKIMCQEKSKNVGECARAKR